VFLGGDAGGADGARIDPPHGGEARLPVRRRFPRLSIPVRWLVGGERGTVVGERGSSLATGRWIREGGETGREAAGLIRRPAAGSSGGHREGGGGSAVEEDDGGLRRASGRLRWRHLRCEAEEAFCMLAVGL
jgi:hypothetical protein